MPRSSRTQPAPSPERTDNARPSITKVAIMAIDPGETNGVSQMHILAGVNPKSKRKNPKAPNHAIRRWRAYELPTLPAAVHGGGMELHMATERGFVLPDPYWQYTRVAHLLVTEWMRFRYHAIRHFGFSPHETFLVMEDWLMPPMIKTRKRETLSPVYVAHSIKGQLEGLAWAHEKQGFGPSHVGSIGWITPAERGAENIFDDEKLQRAGLLLTPKTRNMHANDSTRIGLAFARKYPNVPGLLIPFDGERPEPFAVKMRAQDEEEGRYQLGEAFQYDPADPSRKLGKTKRLRGRSGQPTLARVAAEQTVNKKGWGREKRSKTAFDRP